MNTSLLCFCFKTASSIYVISVCYAGSTRNLHNGTLRLPPATWPSCKVAAFSSLIELMATAHLLQTFSCNNSLLSRSLSLSCQFSSRCGGFWGPKLLSNCYRIVSGLVLKLEILSYPQRSKSVMSMVAISRDRCVFLLWICVNVVMQRGW